MEMYINFFLEGNGWSVCRFYNRDKTYTAVASHAFYEDPIVTYMEALIALMNGQKKQSFTWYTEPGSLYTMLEEVPNQRHLVAYTVFETQADFGESINDLESCTVVIRFRIKKVQLLRMLYFEFKKIVALLQEPSFQLHRKQDFPFPTFRKFEKAALTYIGLI